MTTRTFAVKASLLSLFTVLPILASAGGASPGGGDICEDRIKIIRADLKSWIENGGPEGLTLDQGVTTAQYSQAMLAKIESAQVKCVGPGDKGYPVMIGAVPKVCRFDHDGGDWITCDSLKFKATDQSGQYVLVHHEYAGLAGIELPEGTDSHYHISNQISGFLATEVVKKLSVRPTRTSKSGHSFVKVNRPELGEAWMDDTGLIWGDLIKGDDGKPVELTQLEAIKRCQTVGALVPTDKQILRLIKYFKAMDEDGVEIVYQPQVLPSLTYNSGGNYNLIWAGNASFWAIMATGDFVYIADEGSLTANVRCVVQSN